MLKKIYQFVAKQGKGGKKVAKVVARASQKVLSKVRGFEVPNEISMTNFEMLLGVWDKSVSTVMRKVLKEGSVFVDVGAHVGYFTREASKLVGENGEVYAFEANEENFAKLSKNVSKCANVHPLYAAVSDKPGEVEFFNSPIGSGRHSMVSSRNEESAVTKVPAVTLDDVLKDKLVTLVKIDVEGAELSVLQGMKDIMARTKDLHIILEFFPELFSRQGIAPHTLLQVMKDAGFKIFHLKDHKNYFPIMDPKEFTARLKEKYINIYAVKGE